MIRWNFVVKSKIKSGAAKIKKKNSENRKHHIKTKELTNYRSKTPAPEQF